MAEVTVFVDDAVLGRLPSVCAKDGVPTIDRLHVRSAVNDGARMGVLWLLLLAGPIGWIAFILISGSRNGAGEVLSIEVPVSEGAYLRYRQLGSRQSRAVLVVLAGIAAAVLSVAAEESLGRVMLAGGLLLALGGLSWSVALGWQRDREAVGVRLDASRRWVTLTQVHPAFAAACEQRRDRELHDR